MSSRAVPESYRLVQLIRAGHPCEIWGVRRDSDHARLAMKLLPQGPHHSKDQIAQLRHEYSVGSAVDHENIVRMFEMGSNRDGTYIIMELFDYPNLKQRIQQGIETLAHQTEGIIRQAAESLAHVHERGFLHRDVKPDNFLVSDEGTVKLIDFNLAERPKTGLAKLLGGKSKVQGTKSYMSPEQIRAKTLDVRSDIYSFGCLLHELLSGKVPFTGTSANELLTKHLRSPRPPLEPLNKNVTREFAAFVRRMMAVNPEDRPATMNDVLTELATTPVFRKRPSPPAELPSATKEDQS